jgi:hypothetical protein
VCQFTGLADACMERLVTDIAAVAPVGVEQTAASVRTERLTRHASERCSHDLCDVRRLDGRVRPRARKRVGHGRRWPARTLMLALWCVVTKQTD